MENMSMFEIEPIAVDKKALIDDKGFRARQLKIINWYCAQNNLKPALSNPPHQMNFVHKESGEAKTTSLTNIIDLYNEWNTEDKKRRAQERKLEKAKEQHNGRKF